MQIHTVKRREIWDVTNSVLEAFTAGNKKAILTAQAEKLATMIDSCESARDLPALTKRMNEVLTELEQIPDFSQEILSAHDRLKARRESR